MKKEYIFNEGHNKYFKVPIKLEDKDSIDEEVPKVKSESFDVED